MTNFYLMPTKGSYTESIRYATKAFESINGNTNTEKMVTIPKHMCKYSSLAFYTEKHRGFLNGFMEGLTFKVIHPLWGRAAIITSSNSGTTIYCNTSNSNFKVGGKVFLVDSYDNYREAEITTVNGSNIVVTESINTIEGKLVLPTFYGILTGEISSAYSGERFALCNISIEELR